MMMGPTAVIKAALVADTTDNSSAAAYLAAYSNYFSTVNDVPPELYKSLATLYNVSAPGAMSLSRRIVAVYGLSNTVQSGDIEIQLQNFESSESSETDSETDEPASMIARVRVLVRQPRDSTDDSIVLTISERIYRLLDWTYKTSVLGKEGNLNVPKGTGINPDFNFECRFIGLGGSENTIQRTSLYRVSYTKLILP